MASQQALDRAYMKMAYVAAELSHARRRRVGAILVVPNEGRFEGVNGTPSGFDNNCEFEDYRIEACHGHVSTECVTQEWVQLCCKPQQDGTWLTPRHSIVKKHLVTKPEVLHAESNAIMKAARSHTSSVGGTLYCTLAPCIECAKLIIQAGIVRVVYSEHYPYPGHSGPVRTVGLELLERAKIQVDNLPMECHNSVEGDLGLQDEGRYDSRENAWHDFRP